MDEAIILTYVLTSACCFLGKANCHKPSDALRKHISDQYRVDGIVKIVGRDCAYQEDRELATRMKKRKVQTT